MNVETETASPSPETRKAWGDQLLGRFIVLSDAPEELLSDKTDMECPLCHDVLYWLRVKGFKFGRTIADVKDSDVLVVDVMPPTLKAFGCMQCEVVFYQGDESD